MRTLSRGFTTLCVAATLAPLAVCATAAGAEPSRSFTTGLLDPVFSLGSATTRAAWFDQAVAARAGLVRIPAAWSDVVGPNPPYRPADPADPSYDWTGLDAIVREATARGLEVVLTLTGAPTWAEGPGRPGTADPGTWDPDADAYGAFAKAVATRYSGFYEVETGLFESTISTLPRVAYFQAWNEPNLSQNLGPQSRDGKSLSPEIYRRLLNALHSGVKSVSSENQVITGGTGPFGDDAGGERVRPLAFARELLCLTGRRHIRATPCPQAASFDIFAHHPINTVGGPRDSAAHPDDVTIPDMGGLRRLLRAAERLGTIAPGRRALWATELWWETDPPDSTGISLGRQARWTALAFYELWRQRVAAAIFLGIRDLAYDGKPGRTTLQSGLFFHDGQPKPALTAFRFPFVADRLGPRRIGVFVIPPASGKLLLERKSRGEWRRLAARRVRAQRVRFIKLNSRGKIALRGRLGADSSLVWRLR